MPTAMPAADAAVVKYRRSNVRLLVKWTGKRRLSGVVKMEKTCCRAYDIRLRPKIVQRAMGPLEFQCHVEPEKVSTTMNRTKVRALSTDPTQSIWASLRSPVMFGCGLYRGKRKMYIGAVTRMSRSVTCLEGL